jgi:cytochrome c-type biogenesis protein CcmH
MRMFWAIAALMSICTAMVVVVPLLRRSAGGAAKRFGAGRTAGAAVLVALLPSAAALLYMRLGDPVAIAMEQRASQDTLERHADASTSLETMVGSLAMRLRDGQGSAEDWALLARSYLALGRIDDALLSYRRALALAPHDAQLLADYADVQATANGGDLHGEPMQSVTAALKADPANPKALMLAATAAYNDRDWTRATGLWEQVLRVPGAPAKAVEQARAGIVDAERMANGSAGTTTTTAAARNETCADMLNVAVRVDDRYRPGLDPAATVFVFARKQGQGGMPLAVHRLSARDLPATVRLDATMAMMETNRLATGQHVTVEARVSKSGTADARAGDIVGHANATVGTCRPVEVALDDSVH